MSFRRLSALVVDDCAYMRTIVCAVLRSVGFQRVGEAGDGAEALDELGIAPYDLLITDCAMPTIDGVELTRLLRTAKDSPTPRIPVLMMTAHTERLRIMSARDAGINEIVSKPLSAKTLLDRVTAIIDHPRDWIVSRTYVGPDRRRRSCVKYDGPLRRDSDQGFDIDTVDWKVN